MKLFKNLINLFYPEVCLCCTDYLTENEFDICLNCRNDLPLTNFCNQENNLVEKTFYGRIPVQSGTALFYFSKKGVIQQLIHQLKYKNQQQIGNLVGNWLGETMVLSNRFSKLDCIIPVPLHYKKQQKRGYNQLSTFGTSLANILNIPFYEELLVKKTATKTQSKKTRLDRWKNVEELFVVNNSSVLNNKHILLIDDIITTGATLEACYLALKCCENLKISIACMAYTKY